jgi:hypothetical protein
MIRRAPLPAGIGERLAGLGPVLARCRPVVFAYLFGSAARDRLTPLSDIDVAVYLEEGSDFAGARLEVIRHVTRHLGTDEVDVVVLNTAPAALVGRVLLTRRVIADRDPVRRHRFESAALRTFFDFRIRERQILAARYRCG